MLTPEQISHAWSASFDDPDNRDLQTLFARAIESLVTKGKDKEIERLNAVTNLQLETITDLENRLEKTQAENYELLKMNSDQANTITHLKDSESEKSELCEMDEVAKQFAHKMALDLECILADDYHGKWWSTAIDTVSRYRIAMNAIHEKMSPTFMGEPLLRETNK